MKKMKSLPAVGLSALLVTSAAADVLPYERELGSCVDAIRRNIDLAGASRIRHIVSRSDRDVRGYELTIETIVYGAGATRSYEAVCLGRGELEPLRLEIDGERI